MNSSTYKQHTQHTQHYTHNLIPSATLLCTHNHTPHTHWKNTPHTRFIAHAHIPLVGHIHTHNTHIHTHTYTFSLSLSSYRRPFGRFVRNSYPIKHTFTHTYILYGDIHGWTIQPYTNTKNQYIHTHRVSITHQHAHTYMHAHTHTYPPTTVLCVVEMRLTSQYLVLFYQHNYHLITIINNLKEIHSL